MADKVEVAVTPTTFAITAGDTAEATVTLRNLGQSVDQFTISIDGIDAGWYTLPVSSVALFPNDQDTLKIIINPPKDKTTKAGSYPFCINVASQENPEETCAVNLTVEIKALAEVVLNISPQSITGRRGSYRIEAKNPVDTEVMLNLKASDTEGILQHSLQPETLIVPGGGTSVSTLEVSLGWMAFFGRDKEFDFQVVATIPEVEEPKTVSGKLVRVPWYRTLPKINLSWVKPAIARARKILSAAKRWVLNVRLPWLSRPPAISQFKVETDDKREFTLSWATRRASQVMLDNEEVSKEGERLVSPTEPATYVLTARNRYGSSSRTVEVQPMPIPQAQVSERIRVSLSPTEVQVQAGGAPVIATLQVQNLGDIVDKLSVEIDGIDETWYSRSASSIALMPQATDQVQITFQPPKKKGIKARTYPFAVTVRSQSNPEEVTSVIGQLEVQPLVEFKISVHPYRVTCRRKGKFLVSLSNTGVSDARFILDATDLDEGLDFRFKNDTVEIPAWQKLEVPMKTKPLRGKMVGERKRYDITITARAGESLSQNVNCELHHHPFIGSWKPIMRVLRAVIVIAILGTVIGLLIHWGGGWKTLTSSPQTWVNQLVRFFEGWFNR